MFKIYDFSEASMTTFDDVIKQILNWGVTIFLDLTADVSKSDSTEAFIDWSF